MMGSDMALIAAFICAWMCFRILQSCNFGPALWYRLADIAFWFIAGIVLLIASGAPALRHYCLGC